VKTFSLNINFTSSDCTSEFDSTPGTMVIIYMLMFCFGSRGFLVQLKDKKDVLFLNLFSNYFTNISNHSDTIYGSSEERTLISITK
jgi:hypothetical protein